MPEENIQNAQNAAPQVQPAAAMQPVKPKSNKALWWILGGCGCLIVLCIGAFLAIGGFAYFTVQQAKGPADDFFKLVKEGKSEEAYNSTAKEFKEQTTLPEWKAFVTKYKLEQNDGVSWSATDQTDERTKLQGKIKLPDGDKEVRLDLVKENDTWKVYGFEFK